MGSHRVGHDWSYLAAAAAAATWRKKHWLSKSKVSLQSDHFGDLILHNWWNSPAILRAPEKQGHSLSEGWVLFIFIKPSLPMVALAVKNPLAIARDPRDTGSVPGSGRSLEEGMATRPSILAWRIPWTEEPGGIQSMGSQRARHDWSDLVHTNHVPRFFILILTLSPTWYYCFPQLKAWVENFNYRS